MNISLDEYLKLSGRFFPLGCKTLSDQFISTLQKIKFRPSKKQRWIIHQEVSAFVLHYHHLLFRYLSAADETYYDEVREAFFKKAMEYCRASEKPFTATSKETIEFLIERYNNYEDAAFSEVFQSQHLLYFLSDDESKVLADCPFNQSLSVLCECVSRMIVCKSKKPTSYENDIKPLVIDGINISVQMAALTKVLYTFGDVYISSILPKFINSKTEQDSLYTSPSFVKQ